MMPPYNDAFPRLTRPKDQLETLLATLPSDRINVMTYGMHDGDFFMNFFAPKSEIRPKKQIDQIWNIFEEAISFFAHSPRIQVVTSKELLKMVVPLESNRVLKLEQVLKAANALAWKKLPNFIDLGNDFLSLADAFQAIIACLGYYYEKRILPESVMINEILGPTNDLELKEICGYDVAYTHGYDVAFIGRLKYPPVAIKGEEILKAANKISNEDMKKIPSVISVPSAGRNVNPAEFLDLMTKELQILIREGKPETVILEPKNVLSSLANELRGRFETTRSGQRLRLQYWTIKPARIRPNLLGKNNVYDIN
jgi:hypothetical protein